ncbi:MULTISPECIES: MetQ/NlpA family ABC transporter substrate-binding protein [Pseudomonas syringae group]|uniref:D-methionine-binding lipoprotein MetQ n=1 Tax=Pseudomonas viridiflava TaxID=33069 RepID=A0A1Y6JRM1_PSEVI|nr:MetQ/NlpA family ABC transporter substrate-binding protein [Pseudomonas viridiflava]MCF8978415.1 MetQ/NlpA family ABC transporter substrate-binding protein [Pseudomonas syringae]VVM44701.1 D-methionine-binding lipoprotein MetQ [Pseudomonas fluorescens]MBV1814000.1 MetQ/NlpA family ABC transporter substrate-binding protein [Pseudomonas viridiflava]MEE3926910.1 MetQ/NlpA family ABC transporter substrate-binding protein [Pseudomonas viridiflava]MEE3933137.1 MetQ/NlpA family ABC transporter sub
MTKTLAALALGLLTLNAHAADAPLKVGTTAAFAIPLEAAVEEADKQGLKVELVEFTDWIAPNVTLAAGDIDVNYFQHIPFLTNANEAAGFGLVPYAPGIINNVGLYSKKYKSFDELPSGATVAIANDPINSGRGLQLLAKAGLITLKQGVGYKATEEDITANPKNLKIIQVEAVQLVRAYDDADLVQGYPAYIRLAKTFPADSAILFDGMDHPEYVIQFVIKPERKDDPRLAKFVDIYQHSPVVRAALDKVNGKLYQVGWKE